MSSVWRVTRTGFGPVFVHFDRWGRLHQRTTWRDATGSDALRLIIGAWFDPTNADMLPAVLAAIREAGPEALDAIEAEVRQRRVA